MNPLWDEEKQPCAGLTYDGNLNLALKQIKKIIIKKNIQNNARLLKKSGRVKQD